jgi:cellobiose phosphorylase
MWAKKRLWEIPNDRGEAWNRPWGYTAFHASSLDAAGFEGDKEAFLGMYGELSRPAAVSAASFPIHTANGLMQSDRYM